MQELLEYFTENSVALYIAIGLVSLCVGSFLNVVIYRTPKMMEQDWKREYQEYFHSDQPDTQADRITLSSPASTCPQCHTPIRWYQNIPIVSWILLKGKCGQCKTPISIRYPFVEALTCILSLVMVAVFGASLQMVFGVIFTWVLIALTFIDFDTQLLPDRFTFPLAGLGLAVNSFYLYTSPTQAIWGLLIGFLCLWIVATIYALVTKKEGMGCGDFKLLAALGAWMGPLMLPLIILLSSLVGSIIGVILLKRNKKSIAFAFGPYIAIAGWIAFLWGSKIMQMYLGYL